MRSKNFWCCQAVTLAWLRVRAPSSGTLLSSPQKPVRASKARVALSAGSEVAETSPRGSMRPR